MPYSNSKPLTKISSHQVEILEGAIEHLQEKLKELRKNCPHDFEVYMESWVEDPWTCERSDEVRHKHCKICGYIKSEEY